jgi:predicted GIY-YIG superfamily endonuclease
MPYVIYGLLDPITSEMRYIGYTSDPRRRLRQHHSKQNLKKKSHKNSWIKSILKKGFDVEIVILEECETRIQASQAEIAQIAYHKSIGTRLTNTTAGGDGHPGHKLSAEARKKISASLKGHGCSEQTRAKISASKRNPTPEARRNISAGQRRPRSHCKFGLPIIENVKKLYSEGVTIWKIAKIIGCGRPTVKRMLTLFSGHMDPIVV